MRRSLCHGVKEVMNNIGSALAEHGLTQPAEHYYARALRLEADYTSALWNQARTLKSEGKWKRAAELFERLRDQQPEDFRVPGELGFLYLNRFGLTRQAIQYMQASLALNPHQPQITRNLVALGVGPTTTQPQPTSVLHAEKQTHDFGEVVLDTTAHAELTITNTSDATIELAEPKSDCGCTTAVLKEHRLVPGATTQLSIRFHESHRMGRQDRRVTVTPDTGQSLVIHVHADVVAPYRIEPEKLTVDDMLVGETVERQLRISSRLGEGFRVDGATSKMDQLDLSYDREAAAAKVQSVAVTIRPGNQAGKHEGTIRVSVSGSDGRTTVLPVPVVLQVRSLVELAPKSLFLNALERGGLKKIDVTVDVMDGRALPVKEVVASATWMSLVDPPKVLKGKMTLTVQLDTNQMPDTFNGTIVLRTGQEGMPAVVIPVYGFIK